MGFSVQTRKGYSIGDIYSCRIPDDWFPDLKWDNEPLELMPKGKEATDD